MVCASRRCLQTHGDERAHKQTALQSYKVQLVVICAKQLLFVNETMNPTRAPWATPDGNAKQGAGADGTGMLPTVSSQGVHTGTPVRPLIDAEPALPSVRPETWPGTWEPAAKAIRSQKDVQAALDGSSLRNFVAFTLSLSESVLGCPLSQECPLAPAGEAVIAALDRLSQLCHETPPVTHAVRYGNPGFRNWFDGMQAEAPGLVYNMLGDELGGATIELLPYFLDSFGNKTRIDYGTGHETTFVMLLFCLFSLGVLREEDRQGTVLRIFTRYLSLMRQLQTTFWCALPLCCLLLWSTSGGRTLPKPIPFGQQRLLWERGRRCCTECRLEPAGSHGVWGLDEYHFFPFIFGAAQLQGHPSIRPESITDAAVLEMHSNDYLYLDAVKFVRSVKKGPLHETSPMLYDISGVPSWKKVRVLLSVHLRY